MSGAINCAAHGAQQRALVCRHIVKSLRDGVLRGFYWTDSGDRGWCRSCEALRQKARGQWSPELEAAMGVSLMCRGCVDEVKRINGFD